MGFQSKFATALAVPANFPSLMQPVLARLLNCSSLEDMKDDRDQLFNEYFHEFQSISADVYALREILNTVRCPQCYRSFHMGSPKGRFTFETHKEMHLFQDCGCRLIIKATDKRIQHMKSIHGYTGGEVPETCNCKAMFKNVKIKAMHMKKVHGLEVDLYNCTHLSCTMSFVTEKTRDAHIKAGNHQVQTVCEECGKSFGSRSAWARHRTKHHRPMTCTICQKQIMGSKNLQYHKNRCATGTWKCHVCKMVFASEDELDEHKVSKHVKVKSNLVTCNICFKEFGRLEYLRNHEKRVHFRPPNSRGRHVSASRAKPKSVKKSTRIVETVLLDSSEDISTLDVVEQQFYIN